MSRPFICLYLPDVTSDPDLKSAVGKDLLPAFDYDKPSLIRRTKGPLSTTDPTGTLAISCGLAIFWYDLQNCLKGRP